MPDLPKVLGISIGETVEWAVATADLEAGVLSVLLESDILCELPEGNRLPWRDEDQVFLEERIAEGLSRLHQERPNFFVDIVRIGISCAGIIDRQKRRLVSIARKNWVNPRAAHESTPFIVDFEWLFLSGGRIAALFPRISDLDQIVCQNDASARGLTEFVYGFDREKRPERLLYLMAEEGVNGSIILSGDFPATIGHTEFGHCRPQLHPYDQAFDLRHSGCPAHGICLEGLTSNARFRLQWGRDLWRCPQDSPAWDLAAWYLAQLALNGVLTLQVERVLFGGTIFSGPRGLSLIEKIQKECCRLNAGYLPLVATQADAERIIGRAAFGVEVSVLSALTMASSPGHARSQATPGGTSGLPISPDLSVGQIADNVDNVIKLKPHIDARGRRKR